jgi:hypothetical protein
LQSVRCIEYVPEAIGDSRTIYDIVIEKVVEFDYRAFQDSRVQNVDSHNVDQNAGSDLDHVSWAEEKTGNPCLLRI